jgi:chemotaxis protein CheZ
MQSDQLENKLGVLVEFMRRNPARNYSVPEVAEVTELLITTLRRFLAKTDLSVYSEFQNLARHIADTRKEVSKLKPNELKSHRIPRAGQELAEIVKATEEATNTIMGAAEEIMALDLAAADAKEKADAACMRIFEACSFQDITGQRVTKVVDTLTYIEDRMAGLQKMFGGDERFEDARTGDDALLNGPALQGEGVDQSGVDALMGGDDPAKVKAAAAARAAQAPQAAPAKPAPAKPAAPAVEPGKKASQADIDALFD